MERARSKGVSEDLNEQISKWLGHAEPAVREVFDAIKQNPAFYTGLDGENLDSQSELRLLKFLTYRVKMLSARNVRDGLKIVGSSMFSYAVYHHLESQKIENLTLDEPVEDTYMRVIKDRLEDYLPDPNPRNAPLPRICYTAKSRNDDQRQFAWAHNFVEVRSKDRSKAMMFARADSARERHNRNRKGERTLRGVSPSRPTKQTMQDVRQRLLNSRQLRS